MKKLMLLMTMAAFAIAASLPSQNGTTILGEWKTIDDETPLLAPTQCGNNDILELLIAKSSVNIYYPDRHGITPLHTAASFGNSRSVAILLENGACAEARTLHEETPLHFAAESGDVTTLELCLKATLISLKSL